MFGARTKQYPNLADYVGQRVRPRAPIPNLNAPFTVWGLGLAGLFFLLTQAQGLAMVEFLVLAPLLSAACAFWGYRVVQKTPKIVRSALQESADDVADRLRISIANRRIHLDLHESVALVFDEACLQWKRANALLVSPFWDSVPLSAYWSTIRQQLQSAMDAAMDEALVLVGSDLGSGPPRHAAQEVVEELIGTFVPSARPETDPRLPPCFSPLRELTTKMQDLCGQVELATTQLREREDAPPSATRQIDEILGELRQIHAAESELRIDQKQ